MPQHLRVSVWPHHAVTKKKQVALNHDMREYVTGCGISKSFTNVRCYARGAIILCGLLFPNIGGCCRDANDFVGLAERRSCDRREQKARTTSESKNFRATRPSFGVFFFVMCLFRVLDLFLLCWFLSCWFEVFCVVFFGGVCFS